MSAGIGIRRLTTAAVAVPLLALGLALSAAGGPAPPAQAQPLAQCATTHWVGAWTADPSGTVGTGVSDQTLRIILTPHVGAAQLRVHLTNRYGAVPVTFTHAAVALRSARASIVAGSSHDLTFAGQRSVTVAAGADVVSDPVALSFAPFQDLAVSVYEGGSTGPATGHQFARERSYATASATGDHTADAAADGFVSSTTATAYVDGVDALEPAGVGAVVAFGDSLTDGYSAGPGGSGEDQSGIDANVRYPDDLARRLLAEPGGPRLAVLNAGIGGNRLLVDGASAGAGARGASRLAADVLGVPGVTDAILLEGTNDLGLGANAPDIINGLGAAVAALHAGGLRVVLGTLIPVGAGLLNLGALLPGVYIDSPANAVRVAVNNWIRSRASGADEVVDFDAAMRSPSQPNVLDPAVDSGDHVHPNAAGYARMAAAIDLAGLRGATCAPPVATRILARARVAAARRLRVSGAVLAAAPSDCAGAAVVVRALHAGRTLLARNVGLRSNCHFAATAALRMTGRIEVRVGFAGSPTLLGTQTRTVFVRVR